MSQYDCSFVGSVAAVAGGVVVVDVVVLGVVVVVVVVDVDDCPGAVDAPAGVVAIAQETTAATTNDAAIAHRVVKVRVLEVDRQLARRPCPFSVPICHLSLSSCAVRWPRPGARTPRGPFAQSACLDGCATEKTEDNRTRATTQRHVAAPSALPSEASATTALIGGHRELRRGTIQTVAPAMRPPRSRARSRAGARQRLRSEGS